MVYLALLLSCYSSLFMTAPVAPEVTIWAYLAKYPSVTFGSLGCQAAFRAARVSSGTSSSSVSSGILILMVSPSYTNAIGPPTAASGETWPMDAPRLAPEKRPSVISATVEPKPIPAIAEVGFNISLMPGPPFGPS